MRRIRQSFQHLLFHFIKLPSLWTLFIITISTIFNKHKKQKHKIVENVENLCFFQQVFNNRYFSTILIKMPEKLDIFVKNFVKNEISTISTAPKTIIKY